MNAILWVIAVTAFLMSLANIFLVLSALKLLKTIKKDILESIDFGDILGELDLDFPEFPDMPDMPSVNDIFKKFRGKK